MLTDRVKLVAWRWVWGACAGLSVLASLQWMPGSLVHLLPLQQHEVNTGPVLSGEICVVAPPQPFDPASGLSMYAARPVPPDARCPVCGMYPAKTGTWAAQLIFRNGDAQFFDSPLTLFVYLQDVGRYSRGRQQSEVAVAYVRDLRQGTWLAAASAWYVRGSDTPGPMRAGNLPAFSDLAAAGDYVSAHGGSVLRSTQLDAALLQQLHGARRHTH